MNDIISINAHSSIRIAFDQIIYFDPFHLTEEKHDADIIFITHEHWDHFSLEDIIKIVKPETMFVMPETMTALANEAGIPDSSILAVKPSRKYTIRDIAFSTTPAYNIHKEFHPKNKAWVGYVVQIGEKKVYVCGDTDALPENKNVKCDIMILPVGGTFTMNASEAAAFANAVRPQIAIPSHYGEITGTPVDGLDFSRRLKFGVQSRIMIGQ